MEKFIKNNLRWPGGKSKMIKDLIPFIPEQIENYIEIFCGGASLGINIVQKLNIKKILFNDIDSELINYYNTISNDKKCSQLINELLSVKLQHNKDTFSIIYKEYKEKDISQCDDIERSKIFFVLNKNSFSGLRNSTYSKLAFDQNFSIKSISGCKNIGNLFNKKNIIFSNCDFRNFDYANINNSFIYLDPPYFSNSKNKLYGKDGLLHKNFDHQKLKDFVDQISKNNKIMMSYDNCDEIKNIYNKYSISTFNKRYSMTNTGGNNCKIGKELVIRNYE